MEFLPINEVFVSFQGEGVFMGKRAAFIRLCGCNLKCSFCDTKHKNVNKKLYTKDVDKFVKDLQTNFGTNNRFVILTGGEPTLHKDNSVFLALIRKLKQYNFYIAMETNGIKKLNASISAHIDWITISPKNLNFCLDFNELKVVVGTDIETSKVFIDYVLSKINNSLRAGNKILWLQPQSQCITRAMLNIAELLEVFKCYPSINSSIRAGIQLHKIYQIP